MDLEPAALAAKQPRLLECGYCDPPSDAATTVPAPIKGHGPHRYIFQLFALEGPLGSLGISPDAAATPPDRARPRAVLSAVTSPVLGRGRLTGVFER